MSNKNLGLTVREVYDSCKWLMAHGMGDRHILISNDDEENGYHTLWNGFFTAEEGLSDYKRCLNEEHDLGNHTPENSVILS